MSIFENKVEGRRISFTRIHKQIANLNASDVSVFLTQLDLNADADAKDPAAQVTKHILDCNSRQNVRKHTRRTAHTPDMEQCG